MRSVLRAIMITSMAASGAWAGATDDRWIHVRVDDQGGGNGRVDIQVPIAMVSALLPMLKDKPSSGTVHIDGADVDLDQMRDYWAAVRDAKDGEYITVRDEDARVRIAKSSGRLLLNVDESAGGGRLRMKIPLPLVDAVLAGGKALDLTSIGRALEKSPCGELLSVDDENSHVRMWIDATPAAAREDRP